MTTTVHIPDEGLRRALSLQAVDADDSGHVRAASLARLERVSWSDHGEAEAYPDLWTPIRSLDGLQHGEALRELSLAGNELESLGSLAPLRALEQLWLGGSFVKSLDALGDKPALTRLDVHDNPITDIAPLGRCPALAKLDLGQTKVEDLAPLRALPALTSLSVRGLPIEPESPAFETLVDLAARGVQIIAARPVMMKLRES